MVYVQQPVRFGPFEVDLRTHAAWKDGALLKLAGQPLSVQHLPASEFGNT